LEYVPSVVGIRNSYEMLSTNLKAKYQTGKIIIRRRNENNKLNLSKHRL
jgi:hypothetical protein